MAHFRPSSIVSSSIYSYWLMESDMHSKKRVNKHTWKVGFYACILLAVRFKSIMISFRLFYLRQKQARGTVQIFFLELICKDKTPSFVEKMFKFTKLVLRIEG